MQWYNTFALLGFLTGLIFLVREFKKGNLPVRHAVAMGLAVFVISRIGSYLLYSIENGVWRENWYDYLVFSRGGMSLHGGLYIAIFFIVIYCKFMGLPFLRFLDLFAPPAAFAFSIGRLGCMFAGCCRGFVLPGSLTLPIEIPMRHLFPTPLLYTVVNIAIGACLIGIHQRDNGTGRRTGWFFLLYSMARFAIEFVRTEPIVWGGMTMAQILAIAGSAVGVILILRANTMRIRMGIV